MVIHSGRIMGEGIVWGPVWGPGPPEKPDGPHKTCFERVQGT